jgi:hypothetical protein
MSNITKFLHDRKSNFEILNNPTYKMLFDKNKFKTPSVHSFKHNNMNIDAIFESAYEEDIKGLVCHRIMLIHNKNPIGYLKTFYLPSYVNKKMNPDILHFLSNSKGHSFGLSTHPKNIKISNGRNDFWINKNKDQKQATLESVAITISHSMYNKVIDNENNLTHNEIYKNLLKFVNSNKNIFKNQVEEYLNTHLDKPIIEFSKIKKSNEKMNQKYYSQEIKKYCKKNNIDFDNFGNQQNSTDYQRQGLGNKMYTLMADWMAINNLKLYKGGTNHLSEPLWEISMQNNPNINVVNDENRIYIDHSLKDLSYLYKEKHKIKNKP